MEHGQKDHTKSIMMLYPGWFRNFDNCVTPLPSFSCLRWYYFDVSIMFCNIEKTICTDENTDHSEMNINSAAVFATISTGNGHSQLVEQAILNIPQMSYRQYNKHHSEISKKIFESSLQAMEEAGKEELELAKQTGDVDKDGVGLITVIADGAWSKRSYKVNYDALSGVVSVPYFCLFRF